MPLIDRNSYVNGRQDEDLKQYMMIHIADWDVYYLIPE